MELQGNNRWPHFTRDRVLPEDYFGPFDVKLGRSLMKRYGVIFAYLVVHAIHLEAASSLGTDSFIAVLHSAPALLLKEAR